MDWKAKLKKFLGKNVTKQIRPIGHGLKGLLASYQNGRPADKLKIIGVNGTKGKTTTTAIMGRLYNLIGIKTGYISTSVIYLGEGEEFLNPYKMTTVDPAIMQSYLKQMVENGCTNLVVEMSSQGLEQNRHWGLGEFDATLFLNLYPEHIEAHGSLENYKKCKSRLYHRIKQNGVFITTDEEDQLEYANFMWSAVPPKYHGHVSKKSLRKGRDYDIIENSKSKFKSLVFEGKEYETNFTADFEISNLFFAWKTIEQVEGLNKRSKIAESIQKLKTVPGRMEEVIKSGKDIFHKNAIEISPKLKNVDIIVDYAHEPESMKQMLQTIDSWREKGFIEKIVHILSSDGVGRDDWKKPLLGDISYKLSNITIVTTDNYSPEDNPEDILNAISKNFPKSQKNRKYYKVVDRFEAFTKAIELASESSKKVLIVSTGVGSEKGLTSPDGKREWDEREKWIEAAQTLERRLVEKSA